MTPGAGVWGRLPRRWLARLTFVLVLAAGVVLVVGSAEHGAPLLLTVLAGIVVVLASTYWFLANRGWLRTLALVLLVAAPVAVAWTVVAAGLVLELLVVAFLLLVALTTGRAALAPPGGRARMPEHSAPPPRRPFIVMNPRSGGGKVGRFGLREKAERLGAEVVLLEGPDQVDVALLARHAVAEGADLLGVAGGDGTQALVAGVAADAGVPFMVISAGTRNHFALDLGLDREDPSTCLAALTADAVELHVDLGVVAGRTFVNNASFGAYAAVVQSPEYRDGKTRTTLGLLPDLLSGQAGSRLQVRVDGLTVENPQAVLVSVNPYGMGDVAGLGRRARLDTGELGVVAVTVDSARQAVRLLRHTKDHGLTHAGGPEVVITADTPQIPVGIDGEAVVVDSPVTCTVHPRALRVRVPRHRPGVPPAQPPWNWIALWRLAWPSRSRRGRLR